MGRVDDDRAVHRTVADRVALGARAVREDEVAPCGRVLDRERDELVMFAHVEGLVDDRGLDAVEVVVAVAVDAELQCGEIHASHLRHANGTARL